MKKEKREKKGRKAAAEGVEASSGTKGGIKGVLPRILLLLAGVALIAAAGYIVGNRLLGTLSTPDPIVVTLPTVYTVGEESIPALSIPTGSEIRYTVEKAGEEGDEGSKEDEAPEESAAPVVSEAPSTMDTYIYTYGKITGTDALSADYLTRLNQEYDFLPVDEALNELEVMPELPTETGTVHLVKEVLGEEWLFSVRFSWDAESCAVTVGPLEGDITYIPAEGMTAFEALDYMAALPPAVLGLEEGPDTNYKYYLINGIVMAEGHPCIHINVYGNHPEAGTNMLVGSYLLTSDKSHLYKLDEVNKTITELPLP